MGPRACRGPTQTIHKEATEKANTKVTTEISIPGTLKETYLKLPPSLDWDEWVKVGEKLRALRASSKWAIGDWLVFGEHTFGEKFSQAADITGLEPDTLMVYQWVAASVPYKIRREDLTHAHHQVVAKQEPDDIVRWLERAASKGWSVADLRSALREKAAKAAKKSGDTEKAPKFKVAIDFAEDPGEEFLGRLEAYVARENGVIKKAGW